MGTPCSAAWGLWVAFAVGVAGADAWSAGDTLRGAADALELLEERIGDRQFLMGSEMRHHPGQVWGEPFGTGVVQRRQDHADRGVHLGPVGPPSLLGARPALERALQQSDQALAVEPGDLLYLAQQVLPLIAAGFHVASLHRAQVLVAFVNGHPILSGHFLLGSIYI